MTEESRLPDSVVEAQLEEYRLLFEAGYSDALMHALMFCAKWKVLMPDWVDWELHQAWHRFIRREADDLGEAFGIQWPKGQHRAAYLKRRRLQFAVHRRVNELHFKQEWVHAGGKWRQVKDSEWPIDEGLFEEVGEEFGIGKRLASEYYYDIKRLMGRPPAIAETLLEPYKKPEDADE